LPPKSAPRLGSTLGLLSALLLGSAASIVFPPRIASAFQVVEPQNERSISLVVGTGQLIRVDEEFSSLFVADPDVADIQVKSPRLLYLTGVGVGETTLFAVDEEDNVLMSSTIRVTHNTGALERGLSRVAPGQGLQATSVDRSLVITGTAATPEQAANAVQVATQFVDDPSQIVNRVDIAQPIQVNLQVRVAEVARNVDRALGIQWNRLAYDLGGGASISFVGGRSIPDSYGVGYQDSGRLDVNVVLQALAAEGLVSVLAEPNLTARSGEEASFLAGGEFPYPVQQEEGVTTYDFRPFGVGLTFMPTVVDGNRISLRVGTEVSDLDFSRDAPVPAISSRRAETTVDLASGQSFAIAGLIQNSSSTGISKVPGLGSLPVLGALFRSTEFKRGQTELVIIVTPVIVNPTAPRNLVTPVDAYVPPNDFERIVLGRLQGDPARASEARSQFGQRRLHGAAGFVFE
jgi:pilus assembly protein CpaC